METNAIRAQINLVSMNRLQQDKCEDRLYVEVLPIKVASLRLICVSGEVW